MPLILSIKYTLSIFSKSVLPYLLFTRAGGYYVLPCNLDEGLDRSGALSAHNLKVHFNGTIHESTQCHQIHFASVPQRKPYPPAKAFSFYIFKLSCISVELY